MWFVMVVLVLGWACPAASQTYDDTVLADPGLISYFQFADPLVAPGQTAADSGGSSSNPGTYQVTAAAASGPPGIGGSAVALFDAGYVTLANESNFDFTGNYSLEAWIQTPALTKT
jgi:hypothetical protein